MFRKVVSPGDADAAEAECRRRMKLTAREMAAAGVMLVAGAMVWWLGSGVAMVGPGKMLMGAGAGLLLVRGIERMLCRRKLAEWGRVKVE